MTYLPVHAQTFICRNADNLEAALKKISSSYFLDECSEKKSEVIYFDTFDWSLFSNKSVLKKEGNIYRFYSPKKIVTHEQGGLKKTFFYWDLDESEFKEKLRPLSDIRALMPIIRYENIERDFNVLNNDQKTVVRLCLGSTLGACDKSGKEYVSQVTVQGVKGYEGPFSKVVEIIEKNGCEKVVDHCFVLESLLELAGKTALDYSSKFGLLLPKDSSIYSGVSSISLYLIEAMAKNYHGVMEDIDSEFLHDFRIAIRRTRSLIGQMKKMLPEEPTKHFMAEFKWLGSITGPVRDIDVYLLMKEEYRAMLPTQLHDGLDDFFYDLQKSRVSALKTMREGLQSSRYETLLSEWNSFLSKDVLGKEKKLNKKYHPYAQKLIQKRFNRILKDGSVITDSSPDEALHDLRIQGKKLRYLLEFFRSFFNEKEVDVFIKQLKKLQNNLGDFNDLSVQQDMLIGYKNELVPRSKRSLFISAALGGLITHLAGEHKRVRKKFGATFQDFSSGENQLLFNKTLDL